MNIKIHRGQNQIGGSIIEIFTNTTRILLDVGLELEDEPQPLPNIDGLFSDAAFDAVFISHYHGDHLGLAYHIDKRIPVYMGEAAYRIVAAADTYKNTQTITPAGFLNHRKPITIGDITVTPFLCDHSAFDSYMLLCQADGERILYTGDFRSTGRKSFSRLLHTLPKNIDTLICEGTTLSRERSDSLTETELEQKAVHLFRETNGPVFVLQSSTNIDRLVSLYRAAKRSERIFLEDLYLAQITTAAGEHIPNPCFDDVYAFLTHPKRHDLLTTHKNRMSKAQMAKCPFVMCVRSSMLSYLRSLAETVPFDGGILVFSMWGGYKEMEQMQRFLKGCEELGLKIITLHAGGHADAAAITQLIETVHPKQILPVHTLSPAWFSEYNKYPPA